MYKMIAIDLDGTLLNDEKEISEENIFWIRKAYIERGVLPVVTTGRSIPSTVHYANMIGQDMTKYVISQNGAIVKDVINNEYINFIKIENDTVTKAIKILKSNNLSISIESDKYVIFEEEQTEEQMEMHEKLGNRIKVVDDLSEYDTSDDRITMVSGAGEKEDLLNVLAKLEEFKDILVIPISKYLAINGDNIYEEYYIEFTAAGATKGNGITAVQKQLNIQNEEVIAIGDGGNDISMFEEGRIKVAMGNGAESLKQYADFVTTTNNEHGVAEVIKKYIFNM